MNPDLSQAISQVAQHERVVVATDFDGVLAPLVDDPMSSRALPGDIEALRAMAARPGVTVALVSGRDLDTLVQLSGVDPSTEPVVVIGSHGAQSSRDTAVDLSPRQQAALDGLEVLATAHLAAHPGTRLERKPAARVVHTRGMAPAEAAQATVALLEDVAGRPHVHVLTGKDVVEMSVVEADKGSAVLGLRDAVGATAVVYLGDDRTDERVFERLGDGDVGIKVGDGDTAARYRVADCQEVTGVLQALEQALRTR